MITYITTDQLFDLLGAVSCETDLIEIEHYILSNRAAYTWFDLIILTDIIENLYSILNK